MQKSAVIAATPPIARAKGISQMGGLGSPFQIFVCRRRASHGLRDGQEVAPCSSRKAFRLPQLFSLLPSLPFRQPGIIRTELLKSKIYALYISHS